MPTMRSVMITGASSGIGEDTALYLNQRGWRVFAGVRRTEDGERLRSAATSPELLIPLICDVTDDDSVSAARDAVRIAVGVDGLQGFFSNAGIAAMDGESSAECVPLATVERLVSVNYVGAVRAMQTFMPMIRQSKGTVVVNSAMMTHTVLPFNAGYAPAKAALETWAVALRREVSRYGVRVVIVRAAGVATALEAKGDLSRIPDTTPYPEQRGFLAHGLAMQRERAGSRSLAPRRVAECVADALEGRRSAPYRMVGGGHVPIWVIGTLPARVQDAIMRRLVDRWSAS